MVRRRPVPTGAGIGGENAAINSGIGAILALGIFVLRRHVPESPRWLGRS
ncbi:MAG: hypothetical protein ABIQ61_02375 [Ornithinibacter sp.]